MGDLMEPVSPLDRLWDKEQLAQHLKCSVVKINRMTMLKQIPFIKIGSLVRFRPESIRAWVIERETQPAPKRGRPAKVKV